ncbi:MAG: protein-glutamate O-methyltransferase CheR [bacterium]
MINISEEQLLQFRDFIFVTCGLWFGDSKILILANRLKARMKALNITDPARYFFRISDTDDRAELATLINLITTNETYFFRCEAQMETFCKIVLPEITKEKIARKDRRLRIWSAGCSTGEEPYTIAICVQEAMPFHNLWDISITATDISTEVLSKAIEARYAQRAVSRIPEHILNKYFDAKDGFHILKDKAKSFVEFEYSNLIDAVFETGFDVIFCRNVLIYFRDETKAQMLDKFYDSLADGGYLFLGPSEMVRGLVQGFRMIVTKDAVVFRKEPR